MNFIKVTDTENGGTILINLDNVSFINSVGYGGTGSSIFMNGDGDKYIGARESIEEIQRKIEEDKIK